MPGKQVWQGKSVLVVDDSRFMQEELVALYRGLGMQVVGKARNGSEALLKYEELRPDLISLDIIMPEMHGIDCYRKIKSRFPEALVLFVSCLASDHSLGSHFKEEMASHFFIAKPATRELLEGSLQKLFTQVATQVATEADQQVGQEGP